MTNSEIGQMLEETGLPVFYEHGRRGAVLPYITYTTTSDNFFADDKVYKKVYALRAVLYTDYKSQELEELIEGVFDAHGIAWEREEVYEQGSEVFLEIYESEVM